MKLTTFINWFENELTFCWLQRWNEAWWDSSSVSKFKHCINKQKTATESGKELWKVGKEKEEKKECIP